MVRPGTREVLGLASSEMAGPGTVGSKTVGLEMAPMTEFGLVGSLLASSEMVGLGTVGLETVCSETVGLEMTAESGLAGSVLASSRMISLEMVTRVNFELPCSTIAHPMMATMVMKADLEMAPH